MFLFLWSLDIPSTVLFMELVQVSAVEKYGVFFFVKQATGVANSLLTKLHIVSVETVFTADTHKRDLFGSKFLLSLAGNGLTVTLVVHQPLHVSAGFF